MQKFSVYSVALALSLAFSASLHCSTVWKYDFHAIAGHIEDEIDKHLQPGLQSPETKNVLNSFKQNNIAQLAQMVEQQHQHNPFKSQQDAKAYATQVAQAAAEEFFKGIAKNHVIATMVSLKVYMLERARKEKKETGKITNTLKEVDSLALQNNNWRCDFFGWFR